MKAWDGPAGLSDKRKGEKVAGLVMLLTRRVVITGGWGLKGS